MTKAERQAIKARENDLIEQGIDKVLAKVMAKAEFDCGLINVFEIETETITTFEMI